MTNLESSAGRDYNTVAVLGYPRLIDNFHIEHKPSRSFYLNGRGQQQDVVNLAQNEKTWFVVEFEGGAPDIKSVRVIADDNQQFSGPVEQSK
jgi:hypothetical protein